MPRAPRAVHMRSTVSEPEPPDPFATPAILAAPEDDMGDSTWRSLVELGEQSEKIILFRRYPNGRYGFITEYTPEEFSLQRVRDDHGGGEYLAQFINASKRETGKAPFSIDATPKAKEEVVVVPPTTSADGFKDVLDRQTKLIEQLVARLDQNTGNGTSDKALEIGLRIAEMMRPAQREEKPFAELAEVFKMGADAARGTNDEEGYSGVVNRFAEPIAKLVDHLVSQRMPNGRPAAPAGPARIPSTTPSQPPRPPEATVPPDAPMWLQQLSPHLPMIESWARAGKDPALYADYLLDNIPPGIMLEVEEAAKAPDFVDKLVAVLPMFKPYPAWTKAFLTNIKQTLTQRPPEEDDDHAAGTG